MPDFLLIIKLSLQIFSLKKGSLHFPSFKRMCIVFLILPIFCFIILVNQFFLLLDNILFFSYRSLEIRKSAFVVGVPRSGTTFMFELLSKDKEQFTYFKLWEIIFAPSICQKMIAVFINEIDKKIGEPIYHFSLKLDELIFGDFRDVHKMGLSLPEEDGVLMVHYFSSMYMYYLFPEAKEIKPYLFFDDALSEKKKKRIMQYYYRCVQRHQFVYNRNGRKTFLSKNPGFVAKIDSLTKTFENVKIIYMLRSPEKTIPSLISLNEQVFNVFSRVIPSEERNQESKEIVLKWYDMSLNALSNIPQSQQRTFHFNAFIQNPSKSLQSIYNLLRIRKNIMAEQKILIENHHNYKSKHQYNRNAGLPKNDKGVNDLLKRLENDNSYNSENKKLIMPSEGFSISLKYNQAEKQFICNK